MAKSRKPKSAVSRQVGQHGRGRKLHQACDGFSEQLTTSPGVVVPDNPNSLRAGDRGAILLEDFVVREKFLHFDHGLVPERLVHARDYGAHMGELTAAAVEAKAYVCLVSPQVGGAKSFIGGWAAANESLRGTPAFDWARPGNALSCSATSTALFGKLAELARPAVANTAARYLELNAGHAELLDDDGVASDLAGSLSLMAAVKDKWLPETLSATDIEAFASCQELLVVTTHEDVRRGNPPSDVASKVGTLSGEPRQLLWDTYSSSRRVFP